MSYRNPQIIVDRSAEIWADNISKIGQGFANSIQAYGESKAKAVAAQTLQDEKVGVWTNKCYEKQEQRLREAKKDFKGNEGEWAKYQKEIRELGKSVIGYEVENALNNNLTTEQRDANTQKINDFYDYSETKLDAIGGLYSKADIAHNQEVNQSNYGQIYKATGVELEERFNNMVAGFFTGGVTMYGISAKSANTGAGRNEIMGINYSIEPAQYEEFVKDGLLEAGSLGKPDDKGNYNGRWERNLIEFGQSDEGFFRDVWSQKDPNQALKDAGIINAKTSRLTPESLATEPVREIIDGYEYTRQHVNPDYIFNNLAYKGSKMGTIAEILGLEGQESFYIANQMMGGKIDNKKWNNAIKSKKEEILYQLMFEQDMSRLLNLPDGELPETREATEDDVAYYKKMGWDDITAGVGKKGDDNYERGDNVWFRTHGIKKIDKVGTVTSPNPPTDPKIGGRTLGDAKTILNNITNLGKDREVAGLSEYTFSFKGSNDASMRQYRITPTPSFAPSTNIYDPNYVMVEQASSNGSFTDSNPVKTSMADIRKEFGQEESGEKGKGRFDKK